VIIYIPTKTFNIVYECPDLKAVEFKKRYKIIIAGLKIDNPLRYQFTCVFFFRRAVYASMFIVLASYPSVQIGFAFCSCLVMALYEIIVKPYSTRLSSILSIVNEVLLSIMIVV